MVDYRIYAQPTVAQQSILYLHNVSKVASDANIIFFIGQNESIIATSPVPTNIAYVSLGTGPLFDYRIDTMATSVQQYEIYLHNITAVLDNADIIFFIDANGNIVAIAPVANRISYVIM